MRLGNRKCAGESGSDIAPRKCLVAHGFPGGGGERRGFGRRVDGDARRQFDREHIVRLFDVDPGQPVAEEILPFAPVPGFGNDLQGGDLHALRRCD